MDSSAKKNKGLKTEPEIKEQKKKSSLDKKSIENIFEINSIFFEKTLDAMMIGSKDGRIYAANTTACNMLGWNEKEICRLGRDGIVEQTSKLNAAVRKLKKTGNFFGELTYIKKDGTLFPVEISSSVFKYSDGREFATQIIRDITERKKTEKALQESEERYHALMDKGFKKVFSEGVVKDYPLTIIHKNGKEIEILYNATLFKDEAGKVQEVFAAAHDITVLKKIEEELRKSKELLEKLNQHLIEVRENERNQIALNLHDDLGQKLTAINLNIAWLKSRIGVQSKSVREKFEEMSSMIKETIDSIRETSSLLRPAILFDLGLVPAIKSQLGKFEKQTGIRCHFYFKPEEFKIEDSIALILYRILQESLTNIARHAGASSTEIELHILRNKIEMVIKDDGTGIENDKVNSLRSMGIAGMRERVKSVHGKITFIGERGSGTTVKVLIPIIKENCDD
jgi:PAS domain S-box-containing protein